MSITTKVETINPDTAFAYLESYKANRAIRQSHVNYLASQMSAGLWKETHQGIAFNKRKELVDGHHRMWAVIQSGVTIKIMVARGLEDEDVAFLDAGLARDTKDNAHYNDMDVDPMVWSVAKILARGVTLSNTKVPFPVSLGWYTHYKAGIDAAVAYRSACQPSKQKMSAVMTAALARAYYGMDKPMLDRFVEILRTGQADAKVDIAAVLLRDMWMTGKIGKAQSSESYYKVTAALRAFNERRVIKQIRVAEDEIFTIPKLPIALQYKPQGGGRENANVTKARKRMAEAERQAA